MNPFHDIVRLLFGLGVSVNACEETLSEHIRPILVATFSKKKVAVWHLQQNIPDSLIEGWVHLEHRLWAHKHRPFLPCLFVLLVCRTEKSDHVVLGLSQCACRGHNQLVVPDGLWCRTGPTRSRQIKNTSHHSNKYTAITNAYQILFLVYLHDRERLF